MKAFQWHPVTDKGVCQGAHGIDGASSCDKLCDNVDDRQRKGAEGRSSVPRGMAEDKRVDSSACPTVEELVCLWSPLAKHRMHLFGEEARRDGKSHRDVALRRIEYVDEALLDGGRMRARVHAEETVRGVARNFLRLDEIIVRAALCDGQAQRKRTPCGNIPRLAVVPGVARGSIAAYEGAQSAQLICDGKRKPVLGGHIGGEKVVDGSAVRRGSKAASQLLQKVLGAPRVFEDNVRAGEGVGAVCVQRYANSASSREDGNLFFTRLKAGGLIGEAAFASPTRAIPLMLTAGELGDAVDTKVLDELVDWIRR